MKSFCTNCGINWANLWTENVGDETYEFCPECKSDLYLIDAISSHSYIKSHITGKIINVVTKEELKKEADPALPPSQKSSFDLKEWDKKQKEFEERQERAITAYCNAYETMGREEAEERYFKIMNEEHQINNH